MKRKTFDALLVTGGLVLAAVLLLAGCLLTWAHGFVNNEIHSQLAAEKVFFPPAGSAAINEPGVAPHLNKYAGQQLVNGDQAKAYADHFIAVHLQSIGGGQTYAQLSTKAQADPNNTVLAGQVATVFRGETLRGLLLNAYAYGKMAQIAGYAAIVSFLGAALLLILAALGFLHLRRTDPETELGESGAPREPAVDLV